MPFRGSYRHRQSPMNSPLHVCQSTTDHTSVNTEEDIFAAAVELPEGKRPAYLDAACAGQPDIRARIEALLRSHDISGFMKDGTRCGGLAQLEEKGVFAGLPRARPQPPFDTNDDSESTECRERIGHYKLLEQIGEGGFGIGLDGGAGASRCGGAWR